MRFSPLTQHTGGYIHANWKEHSLWCTSHMSKSHRLSKLSSVLALFFPYIFFLIHEASCLMEIIMWKRRAGFTPLPAPLHRLFQASDVLLDFFELSCRDKANRCLYLLRLRGRFRRKKLHHNQPLQIPLFTLPPKPLTSAAGTHRQESGAFIHLLILIMDHF